MVFQSGSLYFQKKMETSRNLKSREMHTLSPMQVSRMSPVCSTFVLLGRVGETHAGNIVNMADRVALENVFL